jgi:hypothetical protein
MIDINKVLCRRGQIATLDIERPVKMKKGYATAVKISTIQVRLGVGYDNIKAVQVKRDRGELPSDNQGLPWGEWVIPNFLLEHNGKQYLRCATINSKMRVEPRYYRDGKEVSIDVIRGEALSSEFSKRESLDVFNIKLENIVSIR